MLEDLPISTAPTRRLPRSAGMLEIRSTLLRRLSSTGLLVGTLFFAASLTPSLLPRDYLMQGVLSGCSFGAGYGIGSFGRWLWAYLELPELRGRRRRVVTAMVAGLSGAVVFAYLWLASEWQNSLRALMDLAPVDTVQPLRVGLLSFAIFAGLMAIARLFKLTNHVFSQKLKPFIPRRISNVLGLVIAAALFWSLIDGVLFRFGLRAADASFQQIDALVDDELARPGLPIKTGSDGSLIAWEELGHRGRQFVASGPTAEDLSDYFGPDAGVLEPIRVFVGLNSADTVEARAELALRELVRVDAFERSALVIVTPTGTGWIDPAALDTLEYLHGGDVASVAVQYSYLSSWLSLLFEPGYGADSARALFNAIYGHWSDLPEDDRPALYLHGLSLGALNSDLSADLYDVIADPFHGALWSGPPFSTPRWRNVTSDRNPGSPAWLPRFRDGSVIRFTNQENALDLPGAEWGPLRIVYLQYASDPVTFFDPRSAYREPAWMSGPRGPDVSPIFRWFPVVTFLQLTVDLMAATTAPIGHGHVYAHEHYIDAWLHVTRPTGWDGPGVVALKEHFRAARVAEAD
jgi:uncharacterized membrane protein